jgi:hypothetical protein
VVKTAGGQHRLSNRLRKRGRDLAKQTDTSRDPFIERIAYLVARWGLVAPAIAFLEANKPLSFVGSHALLMFQPITDLFVARELSMDLATLLADRDRVELLLVRLETVKAEHRD